MFDIGFLELLILGVVGLLVLGPERLPRAARTAGLWVGRIKRTVSGMQRDISAQLEAEELRQKLDEQQKKLDEGLDRVKRDVERSVEDAPAEDTAAPTPERRLDDALSRARQPGDTDTDAHEDSAAR
ncbi:Sec-independent protein translocase protein TatB [Halomonas koreensis]|uniref:Sec-independent protein translocase protein TatB n=1 Tax=Halomonas koreensis TaxID=245385 RepID=A0ABU1G3W2_9GAMM|nr:Sec-independent protein translocase protein TatB [Halomonas koreensis]MDR5867218.1 Sec-independent protein translocase protein TatB [Halomonas koreensis]